MLQCIDRLYKEITCSDILTIGFGFTDHDHTAPLANIVCFVLLCIIVRLTVLKRVW